MKTNIKKTVFLILFIFVVCFISCLINDLVKGEFGYSVKGLFNKSSAARLDISNKEVAKVTQLKDTREEDNTIEDTSTEIVLVEPTEVPSEDENTTDNTQETTNEPVVEQPIIEQPTPEPVPEPTPEPVTDTTNDSNVTSNENSVSEPTPPPVVIPQFTGPRYAYLTFDDGPSLNTIRILDILDSYGVKGTFFVMYHEGFEDAYRQIASRGHTIALHTYSHVYSSIYTSEAAYYEDLNNISNYITQLTGVTTKLIRFPGGSSNGISKQFCPGLMTSLITTTAQNGYIYYDWNVDSMDASKASVPAEDIVNNVLTASATKRNSYILMHDLETKNTTVDALPAIIEGLVAQGYTIIPMTELTPPCHHSVIYN